jgi:chromosome partitioning protein
VAPAHFRRVLRQNPDLPQGLTETEGGAKWFTLDEVLRLRAHFAAEGSKAKDYRPYRPEGLPAKIVAVANFKGGVGKTSTAAHLAMSAALDGYRVLVVDLDSQGSMTSIFGGRIADEWQTAFPLLARHYAEYLRKENRARQGRGETPQSLDETLTEALSVSAGDLIQGRTGPISTSSARSSISTGRSSRSPSGGCRGAAGSSGTRSATGWRPTGCCRTTTSSSSIRRPRSGT